MCEPGPDWSVVAAKLPCGGAATGNPDCGEVVPLYANQLPLPLFTTFQPLSVPVSKLPPATLAPSALPGRSRTRAAAPTTKHFAIRPLSPALIVFLLPVVLRLLVIVPPSDRFARATGRRQKPRSIREPSAARSRPHGTLRPRRGSAPPR